MGALGLGAVAVMLLAGCAPTVPESAGGATTGGADVTPHPSPGSTVSPRATGGDGIPDGYRVALILPDAEPPTLALRDGARAVAAEWPAEVSEVTAAKPDLDGVAEAVEEAVQTDPDLIVGLGGGVVDAFALLTAQALDRPFLVLGAQLPEPTENVTAVTWDGAASRGSSPGGDGTDAATFTAERGAAALEAGVAAVVSGETGMVIALTE